MKRRQALLQQNSHTPVSATALGAMLIFFVMEHIIHWHHEHQDHSIHEKPVGYLVIVGDAFHNFFDGVAIAAGFAAAPELGITTTLAIIIHEIPQELSNSPLAGSYT
jgi:zinc and cadmium transporter